MISLRAPIRNLVAASLVAWFASVYAPPSHAQLQEGCRGINYVGAILFKPFTAESVTTSTSTHSTREEKFSESRELVARDGKGRIRFEKHGVSQPPGSQNTITLESPDGIPFTVTREEYGTLITILTARWGRRRPSNPEWELPG